MRIVTFNDKGEKEIIEYSKKVVKAEEVKSDIVIGDDCYDTFKMCVQKMQEQHEYVGGGDKRYEKALSDLIHRNHGLYEQYSNKLREEFMAARK